MNRASFPEPSRSPLPSSISRPREKNMVAYVENVPIPTTYSSPTAYRASFHIALCERGFRL
jgi:hypothetical protein